MRDAFEMLSARENKDALDARTPAMTAVSSTSSSARTSADATSFRAAGNFLAKDTIQHRICWLLTAVARPRPAAAGPALQ